MAQQLRLNLEQQGPYRRADFVAGPSNAQARAALEAWPNWPGGCLALTGPEGVGKSHLAQAWAAETGAVLLSRDALAHDLPTDRPALLEDADDGAPDEALFHLINQAARGAGTLLMTARALPAAWPCALPDLRSRLNALFVAPIEEPDDAVLKGVLRNLFRNRSIRPTAEVYSYLLSRMPRSVPEAREVVRRMDEAGDGPISRRLARAVLEHTYQNLDDFG